MSNVQWVGAFSNVFGPDAQALLVQATNEWRAAGRCVAGLVAENPSAEAGCAAGHLIDLTSGTQVLVVEDATVGLRARKPSKAGLAQAVRLALPQVQQAEIVVISKFGELETKQRGLWPLFMAATIADKPVLTTVEVDHKLAFERYAPQVQYLNPMLEEVLRWSLQALVR